MRPVYLPDASGQYNEKELQDNQIEVAPYGVHDVKDVCQLVSQYLDDWVINGAVVESGKAIFYPGDSDKNIEENKKYTACRDALSKDHKYGKARLGLIGSIGGYCSYCEMPLASALAVEHRLPKNWFPKDRLSWKNFLLACPICNSIKGDDPWLKVEGKFLDTQQASIRNQDLYGWPNTWWAAFTGPNYSMPYGFVLKRMARQDDGLFVEGEIISDPAVISGIIDSVRKNKGIITHGMFAVSENPLGDPRYFRALTNGGYSYNYDYYALLICPTNSSIQDSVARMINLVGLNRISTGNDQSVSDLRVATRTLTYFRAMAMKEAVSESVEALGTIEDPGEIAEQWMVPILSTMKQTGFWSVWSLVFSSMSKQTDINQTYTGTVNNTWVW